MRNVIAIYIVFSLAFAAASGLYVVNNDNGEARDMGYYDRPMWEESVFLKPGGDCVAKELYVYLTGDSPGKDTIYVTGDPAEGVLPGTFWVIAYNQITEPIAIDYDGEPGWDTLKLNDLRVDGYQRLCIQHRLKPGGPWFAVDNDGTSDPLNSFSMDPESENDYGWPGVIYRASGDYLVRVGVEFDYPAEDGSAPPPPPVLVDVAYRAGLVRENGNAIGSHKISIADWNGDGYDDVAMGSYFFENNGDGSFNNVSEEMNIEAQTTMWADYDNDGDLDCYTINEKNINNELIFVNSKNTIYENESGSFTKLDPTEVFQRPYPNPSEEFDLDEKYENDSIHNPYVCWAPVWLDYDGDGDLDLYLGNRRSAGSYPHEVFNPDKLWQNNGDGTFSDASESSGIFELCKHKPGEDRNQGNLYFNGQDASACDYNMDGKIDIHMINYGLERDFLYKNNGDGTFSDVAADVNLDGYFFLNPNPDALTHGHSVEWGDFNNDGYPEPYVGNLAHPDWRGLFSNPSMIFKSSGPPDFNFTQVQHEIGLKFTESDCGVMWIDFNQDGYLDLWYGQRYGKIAHIYMNQGPPDFKLRETTWLFSDPVYATWTAAKLDFDNDGDLDLLSKGMLFRNDLSGASNWIAFRLEGEPSEGVPNGGYGTRVTVHADGKLFYRDLMGEKAGPRHMQNTSELNFGLGDAEQIDSVVVNYCNGNKKVITDIDINGKYIIPYMSNPVFIGLSAPSLVYPANFDEGIDERPEFQWTPVATADEYQAQAWQSGAMGAYLDTAVSENSVSFDEDLKSNYTYYWRVRAFSGADTSSWSSVWSFTVGLPQPSRPSLISPEDGSEDVSAKPTFKWKGAGYETDYADAPSYEINFSKNPDFSEIIVPQDLTKDTVLKLGDALPPDEEIFWRVQGVNDSVRGQWSLVWSFTTEPIPAVPELISPEDGDSTIKSRPIFDWEETEYADYYHIQIAYDAEFTDIFNEDSAVKNNGYVLFKKYEKNKTHYWRVRAFNDGGGSDWSEVRTFMLKDEIGVADSRKVALVNEFDCVPNPMFASTTIRVNLEREAKIKIEIRDISGAEIQTLHEGLASSGASEYKWEPKLLSSGTYFIILTIGDKTYVKSLKRVK